MGGRVSELSGLYLNFDAASNLLENKLDAVQNHPNIQVLTGAEVTEVGGYVGNFVVKVEQQEGESTDGAQSVATPEQLVPYTFDIGSIVVATGYDLYDRDRLGEYGGTRFPDVIDGLHHRRERCRRNGYR